MDRKMHKGKYFENLIFMFLYSILILFSCQTYKIGNDSEDNLYKYFEYRNNLINIYNNTRDILSIYEFTMENAYFLFNSYGFQSNIFTGEYYFVDIMYVGMEYGSKIFSITDGEVIDIDYNSEMGNYIKIKNGDIIIEYGNLLNIEIRINDKIANNQYIGNSGILSEPYGNVLKLRIKYKDIPLNPILLLNYDNNKRGITY
jgi:hypothetical protein